MNRTWAAPLLTTLLLATTAACTHPPATATPPSLPASPPVLVWQVTAGPCHTGYTCVTRLSIDGGGHATYVDGGDTLTADLPPADLADLARTFGSPDTLAALHRFRTCKAILGPLAIHETLLVAMTGAPRVEATLSDSKGPLSCDGALYDRLDAALRQIRERYFQSR